MFFLLQPEIREIIRRNYYRTGRTGLRSFWDYQITRRGSILCAERDGPNIWHDDGEEFVCKVVFSEAVTVPANYYVGLDGKSALAEADTLAGLAGQEPSGNGYARSAIPSDTVGWTVSQDAGDWQAASTNEVFTASGGNWGTMRNIFLTDQISAQTGKYLIASKALSAARVINNGDSLTASIKIKIKEAA